MIEEVHGECNFTDCGEPATQIAADAMFDAVGVYCDEHAETVSASHQPVYVADCPNCHCAFGVWP